MKRLLVLAVVVAGCGDNPTKPSALAARSLTVVLVQVESAYQATGVAAFSDGSSTNVTADVEWTSSNPAVATVSATGMVSPLAQGATEIRGRYQTVSGSASLTIGSSPATPTPAPGPTPPPTTPGPSTVTRRIDGTIRDALDQEPVSSVRVTVTSGGKTSSTLTDNTGRYTLFDVLDGTVTVSATLAGYADQSQQLVVAGNATADFTLQPLPFTLSGTVGDGFSYEDLWCEPARVEILDGANAGRSTVVWRSPIRNTPRNFEVPNVQPGTARIRVSTFEDQYRTAEVTTRLRASPTKLTLRLGRYPNNEAHPQCWTIAVGGSVGAHFRASGTTARVTFDAAAGQPITVRFTDNPLGTIRADLLRPDLSVMTTRTSSGVFDMTVPSLPVTGTYTILIAPNAGSGTVTVAVTSP